MNAAPVIVVLVALLFFLASRMRSRQAGRRRIRLMASRFLKHGNRRAGMRLAKEVARAIIEDRPDPVAHLAAGVILKMGEHAWARVPARLALLTSQPAWMADTHVSWRDHGRIEWLITSQRLIGRLPATSELISLWWSELSGVDVDLRRDRVTLNALNGWTGMLSGPAVAPIAVSAIAMCQGLEETFLHPALAVLWQQHPKFLTPLQGDGSQATIVRLPTRSPTV